MIIYNKTRQLFFVSVVRQTFLGFEITSNFRDTPPLIGPDGTSISKGLVLLFFKEPIHIGFVFLPFSFRPEILPKLPKTDILSRNDIVSLHINVVSSANSFNGIR